MKIVAAVAACTLPHIAASAPSALIVAVKGERTPPVERFDEVSAGDRFVLGAEAEMVIVHYAACNRTHFRGGVVQITPTGFAGDGEPLAEKSVKCPNTVLLARGSDASLGTILRGSDKRTPINLRPTFVVRVQGASGIAVRNSDGTIEVLPVNDGVADWPDGAPSLTPGARYEFDVRVGDKTFSHPAAADAGAGLTVIRP